MSTIVRSITKVEEEAMRGNLIYLATPYSEYRDGYAAASARAAKIAAQMAVSHGAVFSPVVHGHQLAVHGGDGTEAVYYPLNEAMLAACDVLVVVPLDGWESSVGMAQEIEYFQRAGKPVFDLNLSNMQLTCRRQLRPPRDRFECKSSEELKQHHADWFSSPPAL